MCKWDEWNFIPLFYLGKCQLSIYLWKWLLAHLITVSFQYLNIVFPLVDCSYRVRRKVTHWVVSFSRTSFFCDNPSMCTYLTTKHWIFGASDSAGVTWGYCLLSRSFWWDAAGLWRPLFSVQLSSFSQCYHKDTQVLSYLLPERECCQAAVQAVLSEADPAHHLSAPEDLPCCHAHWLLKSPPTDLLAPWRAACGS